jgi:hypothetical protein
MMHELYDKFKGSSALESLHYTHSSCELISDAGINTCKSSQALEMCLYGDSQTRNLNNAIVQLLKGTTHNAHSRSHKPKEIRSSQQTHYIEGQYGTDLGKIDHNCGTIFMNFGHWPAGYPGMHAWTVSQYASTVEEVLIKVQNLNPDKRLIWLTTHSFGERIELYLRLDNTTSTITKDWRSDVVLQKYNEAAKKSCRRVGVEFIEVFDVLNALHDLAFDGCHYSGPIEKQVARTVLHRLCVS